MPPKLNIAVLVRSSFGVFIAVLRIRDVYPGSRIPDPDFYPSRIPDPGSRISDPGSRIQKQQQKREVKKKLVVIPFYVATNFTKL